jgi:hypothetical protein
MPPACPVSTLWLELLKATPSIVTAITAIVGVAWAGLNLKNGGTLERAATMANHASTRTTQLCDRQPNVVTFDEVERVLI